MSHIVLGLNPGNHIVRYKNGNQLDNRKENLIVSSYNPKNSKGTSMSTPSNSDNIGRIRIVDNSFQINYCIDEETNTWETKIFKIEDYDTMEDAYKAAKIFRKNFKM